MGTINYRTSDYITLGLRPYEMNDFLEDRCFMEETQKEIEEYGGTIEDKIYSLINAYCEDDYINIKHILSKYNFHYYHVKLEHGYYEGFSIDIENNFGIAYDCCEDKREAQKEITQIKKFLLECAENGLVSVWPGWCTTYRTRAETYDDIAAAIKEMRNEARTIPTWRDYERGGAA